MDRASSSSSNRIGVALLGHGTVGRGVVRILADADGDLFRRTGLRFDLVSIAVRDLTKHSDVAAALPLTADSIAAATDSRAGIVIELIGGVERARELVLAAISAGKHIVTANKALLAAHGHELFAAAKENRVALAFEASCGGGIPIVGSLTNGLLANRCHALVGILNGTSNFILTKMTNEGKTYANALKEAQDAGYAEADPTLDVNGRDVAQKLAILAGLAFSEKINDFSIHVEGIESLDATDIGFAGELGYVVKLLATALRDEDGRLILSVYPGLLPKRNAIADVSGPFNAVAVWGDAVGHTTFIGRGAGAMPTASGVVADVLSIALGSYPPLFEKLQIFPNNARNSDVLDFAQTSHRYYLRLTARDVPGVLADITRCLGSAGISISSVLQHEARGSGELVPVIITTHVAREGSVRQAVAAIDALAGVKPSTTVLRIADLPSENSA